MPLAKKLPSPPSARGDDAKRIEVASKRGRIGSHLLWEVPPLTCGSFLGGAGNRVVSEF